MNKILALNSTFEGMKEPSIQEKLSWFMFLRIGVVTSLLAFFIFFKLKTPSEQVSTQLIAVYFLLAITYLSNFIYALFLKRIQNIRLFVGSQIIYDVLFTTALLYFVKTPESIFNILYPVTIIFASLLFQRTGALLTANFCTICFSLYLIYNPIIDSQRHLYVLFINNFIFYLIALASGTLSEQLKITGIKLKEKESFTSAIVDNITSGLLTVDTDNTITYYNKAATDITGKSFEKVFGRKIERVFPEFAVVLETYTDPATRPEITYKKDDETLSLGVFVSPLNDFEGHTKGKILIFQDFTQLKKMEEDMRISDKLAAVGKLAAGIAHEIRNPLASMSGSIQVLKKSLPLKEDDQRLMNIILKETERLNNLITEFLTFVKPSGIRKAKVQFKKFVEETVDTLKINPNFQKNITIHTEGEDTALFIDPEKFKQILWNLLINSSQAMPEGGDVYISWNKNTHFSILKVKDTGGGIPEDIRNKVFDPFFTTKEGGTGLGLATVYKIVEAHRGRIHVVSSVNKGTTFIIEIPNT